MHDIVYMLLNYDVYVPTDNYVHDIVCMYVSVYVILVFAYTRLILIIYAPPEWRLWNPRQPDIENLANFRHETVTRSPRVS